MQTDFKQPFTVETKYSAGAYTTNSVNGQRASSTMSAEAAVMRLADKLLGEAWVSVEVQNQAGFIWQVKPDPMLSAFAWPNGVIECGDTLPTGTLLIAVGPERALRHALALSEAEGKIAQTADKRLAMAPADLAEWCSWGARLNGTPQAHGVRFITREVLPCSM